MTFVKEPWTEWQLANFFFPLWGTGSSAQVIRLHDVSVPDHVPSDWQDLVRLPTSS